MYECVLPSTGERVSVRGLTLREEVELQNSTYLLENTLYSIFSNLAKVCKNAMGAQDVPLEIWCDSKTEADLHALCFALYNDTYGPTLRVSMVCPYCNETTETIVDLNKVDVQGKVNDGSEDVFQRDSVIVNDSIVVERGKYLTLSDQLLVFSVTGVTLEGLRGVSIDEQSLLISRFATIKSISIGDRVFSRPPFVAPESKLKEWFSFLEEKLAGIPVRVYKEKIQSKESPYSLTFYSKVKCKNKDCKKEVNIELNFFRYLLESVAL